MLPCSSFRQDKPAPAVDELARRVEMASVACCLSHDMEHDLPQVVQPEVAEEVAGPPGRCGVQGCGGNDGVRAVDLPPIHLEHGLGRHLRADVPGVGGIGQSVDGRLLASDDGAAYPACASCRSPSQVANSVATMRAPVTPSEACEHR
jgi:hypothetical protein